MGLGTDFKKIAAIGAIISIGIILAGCNTDRTPTGGGQQQQQQQRPQVSPTGEIVTVTATDAGFTPAQATVASGGGIKWVNNASKKIQIASDPHPVHTANGELTNGEFVIDLSPEATATVVVSRKGTWGYHNHLNPGVRGKVVVK